MRRLCSFYHRSVPTTGGAGDHKHQDVPYFIEFTGSNTLRLCLLICVNAKEMGDMDIEHVVFSVGQAGALEAYERVASLKSWAAHLVVFGDHMPATVFTSDTPSRLTAHHRGVIEQAVVEAGKQRYIGQLEPVYASRVSRRLGRYFMTMAQGVTQATKQPAYAPALITTQVVV